MNPQEIITKFSERKLPEGRTITDFTLKDHVMEHSQFSKAMTMIAEVHQLRRVKGYGAGFVLMAESGFGKSVILQQYQSYFPRCSVNLKSVIPVVFITLPSRPTDLSMATAVLDAMGHPLASKKENAAEKTKKIYELFNTCKVELILIDELHHLDKSHNSVEYYVALNWLKNLISLGNASVVTAGLPRTKSIIQGNKELKRRFIKELTLTPFEWTDKFSFVEFRSILKKFGELLPFECETPLQEQNLARRILIASHGLLDYVRQLLDGAVYIAQFMHKPIINLEVLATAFREYIWSDVPEKLNPFNPKATLRKLDKFGEPFHLSEKYWKGGKNE